MGPPVDLLLSPPDPSEWLERRFPHPPDDAGPVFDVSDDGDVNLIGRHGIADRLSIRGKPRRPIVWVPEEEQFYRYSSSEGTYDACSEDRVKAVVDELLRDCASSCADEYEKAIHRLRSRHYLNNIVSGIRATSQVKPGVFDFSRTQLPVANGLLDIETGELRSLGRRDYARWKLDIPWDPRASEPSGFLEFLDRLFPHPDDRTLALRVMAMTLLANPFQKMVFLIGEGGSGKSSYTKLLAKLVGPASGDLNLGHAEKRFAALPWRGKLLLHQAETDSEMIAANGRVLKAISGQDPIAAEQKYRNERVSFIPRALPLLVSNERLRVPVNGDLEAWKRRLLVLETGNEPIPKEEREQDIEDSLLAREGSGILRLVVEEASELLELIETGGGLSLSDRQIVQRSRFLRDADPLETFIERYVVKDPDAELEQPELVAAYRRFLEENGMEPPTNVQVPSEKKEFIERLGGTYARSVGDNQRGWRGVRLT
jgi:putative DNA primase/helicase